MKLHWLRSGNWFEWPFDQFRYFSIKKFQENTLSYFIGESSNYIHNSSKIKSNYLVETFFSWFHHSKFLFLPSPITFTGNIPKSTNYFSSFCNRKMQLNRWQCCNILLICFVWKLHLMKIIKLVSIDLDFIFLFSFQLINNINKLKSPNIKKTSSCCCHSNWSKIRFELFESVRNYIRWWMWWRCSCPIFD